MFTKKANYQRHIVLIDIEKFRDNSIAIIGCGAIGSFVAISLAKMGLTQFHLYDFDEVEPNDIEDYLEDDIDDKYYYDDRFKVWDAVKSGVKKKVYKNVVYQYRRYYVRENKSGVCPTLTANMGSGGHNVPLIKDDNGIRKLTPRECFNLQGFPKKYKLPNISDSKLYKLAGNCVSVPVVKLLADKIINVLEL